MKPGGTSSGRREVTRPCPGLRHVEAPEEDREAPYLWGHTQSAH